MPATGSPPPYGSTLFEALWQYRVWVVATALIAALAGYLVAFQQPAVYEASARLLLADPGDGRLYGEAPRVVEPNRNLRNKAEIAHSAPVLAIAADLLAERWTTVDLASAVTVVPAVDRDLLIVTARAGSSSEAVDVANSVAAAYQQHEEEAARAQASRSIRELTEAVNALQVDLDDTERRLRGDAGNDGLVARRSAIMEQQFSLRTRIQHITTDVALAGSGVELFEEAVPPRTPADPLPLRAALVASVLASVIAALACWWAANRRPHGDTGHGDRRRGDRRREHADGQPPGSPDQPGRRDEVPAGV